MSGAPDEVLNSKEVAARLAVGRRTAQRRIHEAMQTGEITVIGSGGAGHEYFIYARDVDKLAREGTDGQQ